MNCIRLLILTGLLGFSQGTEESVWKDFTAWIEKYDSRGNPALFQQHYREHLAGSGVPAAEVDRRLGIVRRRLLTDDGWRVRFNNIYATSNGEFSTEPNALLVSTMQGLSKGTALDIGMGQGRNTLYLARQGWKVTGIDVSDEGIAQAKRAAAQSGLQITALQQSYSEFDFGDSRWDLILVAYEPLPIAETQWVERLQRSLRPGGVLVVETFAADAAVAARPPVALDPLRLRDAY
jgi:2-polyprenyl-3-methyl-5-hydroxy-6-metoxy-1,4-benzoquinol methylase